MIKFKKSISFVGILLILLFSIYGCSDENSNNNFNESNITTSESTSNIVTLEQAFNIVEYSNKLKNIQENLRGGEHEVFFRSLGIENIKQNQIKGYSIDALIYNPARNNGEEKIGHFFVSEETGGLFFYDPAFSDYFPVN